MSRTPREPFDPFKPSVRAVPRKAASELLPHEQHSLMESVPVEDLPGAPSVEETLAGTLSKPLSVSRVNGFLQRLLAMALPPTFFVQGEISNFRTYDRGHAFFTMKDAGAELPCILWKDDLARLKFKPKDGLSVIAKGAIRLYEVQGRLQLYVDTLYPQGAGALELAFRQLCEKLKAEGLFEAGRKRAIPRVPRRVAVITSRTGDVLHDVLTTAWRRFPGLEVLLCPVRVQGEQAAGDIIQALRTLNGRAIPSASGERPIDLILLVRGGGSLEDLWAFNEERLARAIVASRIPIATGIGHEPDTTIADLVGDLRGPTPTGVTELTIPDVRGLLAELASKSALLTRDLHRTHSLACHALERAGERLKISTVEAIRNRQLRIDLLCRQIERIEPRHAIAQGWRRVEEGERRLGRVVRLRSQRQAESLIAMTHRLERSSPVPQIGRQRDRVTSLQSRLQTALRARFAACTEKLAAVDAQLRLVSPQATLDRGYSITTLKDGTIVRSAGQVKKGDVLQTRLAEGEVTSTVGKPKQESLF